MIPEQIENDDLQILYESIEFSLKFSKDLSLFLVNFCKFLNFLTNFHIKIIKK